MDVLQLTCELINIPSESSEQLIANNAPEAGIVHFLTGLCRSAGLEVARCDVLPGRQNLIVRLPKDGAPKLLIIAHMDTVSGRGVVDPFVARQADLRIYGRGACDDKGPLAAALTTLLDLHKEKAELAWDITFGATVDEECNMAGAIALADHVTAWDLCIGLEPTRLKIIRAHKGVYRFLVKTRGHAAHSSEPEKGENAIDKMLPIIADLRQLGEELHNSDHADLGRPSLAVTRISGGASLNIIPDSCEAGIDIRLLPGMTEEEIGRRVSQCVAGRGEIFSVYHCAGIQTEMDNPLIKRLQEEIGQAGHDSAPGCVHFATDCSKLAHKGPCIVWGPGDIAQAHQAVEFIEIDQLTAACRILRNFLCL